MNKAELRQHLAAHLRATMPTAAQREAASSAIRRAIEQHRAWTEARLVCAFFPLPSEPQISALWDEAGGRTFCFPRPRDGDIDLIRIDDPELLRRATWRLDAPEFATAPVVDPQAVDLFLVPGLGFTAQGRRLGRGGGYYDRLLPRRAARSTALGICFAAQLVAELPLEPHDHEMDGVVTELGEITNGK